MKTYFYEKPNGEIFACEANEAADVHYKRKWKQIGVSDGAIYSSALKKAPNPRIKALHRKLFRGLENSDYNPDLLLEYEELVSERKLELQEAFNRELEAAKGHLEYPPSNDILGGANIINQTKLK